MLTFLNLLPYKVNYVRDFMLNRNYHISYNMKVDVNFILYVDFIRLS